MLCAGVAAEKQQQFCDLLLDIGNGEYPTVATSTASTSSDYIQLPPDMVSQAASEDELIDNVFGELGVTPSVGRAILSTHNADINKLNAKITERFPGQVRLCLTRCASISISIGTGYRIVQSHMRAPLAICNVDPLCLHGMHQA